MNYYCYLTDAKWDENMNKFHVPYVFYEGKWYEDLMYLTPDEFLEILWNKKTVRKFGKKAWVITN